MKPHVICGYAISLTKDNVNSSHHLQRWAENRRSGADPNLIVLLRFFRFGSVVYDLNPSVACYLSITCCLGFFKALNVEYDGCPAKTVGLLS
ncbi:hypothetical protein CUMW_134860 [Citrus unshiu]|nr:hypothetical protein CUMW_134860 [Citrus unshiu]